MHYKDKLKNRIKNWISSLQEKQQTEWLIVNVTDGSKSVRSELSSKLHRSVLDKIKTDFNTKQNR